MNANETLEAVVLMNDSPEIFVNGAGQIAVQGDTLPAVRENIARVRDAATAYGAKAVLKKNARGYSIEAVAHTNDPFHQINFYVARMRLVVK